MSDYNDTEISAAYSDLCQQLTIESKVSESDWDGMARVAEDAEKMIANQLAREGMSMVEAINCVQEASSKTARSTDVSKRLVDAALQNRFIAVEASNDVDEKEANDSANVVNQSASVAASASNQENAATESPVGAATVNQPAALATAGSTVVQEHQERSQRLHQKIGYKIEMKKVCEIFQAIDANNPLFDFKIPYVVWNKEHPGVPVIDRAYNMEEESLATVLYAISNKKSTAIVGPHGAGKTKLVEQVAARLNLPVTVIPVDGQITRSELFGQEKIRSTPTGPESYFQYGILPCALEEPGIILFDEIDRADPAIQYACHSVYEQTYLLLMEHDGRRIPLHEYNRVFATANTKGRGSDDGMYGGDNEMSEATRDRFSLWIEIDYQDVEDDITVLKAKVKNLDDKCAKSIAKLAQMIRNGFKDASLSQTCSMRQQLEAAEMAVHFIATTKAKTKEEKMGCLRRALDRVILGRANEQDKNSIGEYLITIEPALVTTPATSQP